jgi:WD repeat-containing protein 23
MYDTSNPYHWKYYKTVVYPYGQWTITDASLSPDNKYLAYSSISSVVCLASTDPSETGEQPWLLDFADLGGSRRHIGRRYHSFGVGGSILSIWNVLNLTSRRYGQYVFPEMAEN